MERVVHIISVKDLENFENKYNRIYIGADSCPNLLPTLNELERYLDFAFKNNLKVSLMTSFCFDIHIDRFRNLISLLERYRVDLDIEIIINDWGILQVLKGKNFKLVLGRLLTKQKKGPRIEDIVDTLTPSQIKAYREVPSEFYEDFLIENNIVRIELDNNLVGIDYNGKIVASLYYPYVFVSPSSLCLFFGKVSNKEKICQRECLNNYLVLESEEFKRELYRKGNSFFYKNKDLPKNKNNIDRIVIFRRF